MSLSGKVYIKIIALLFLCLHPVWASAEENDNNIIQQKGSLELGGCVGTPSGINSRFWFTEKFGIEGMLGLSMNYDPVFALDFIFEEFRLTRSEIWETRLFFGLGSLLSREDDAMKNAVRIPVGLSFPFYKYSFNLSLYAAPGLEVRPDKEFEFNWGIGVRYNFGRAGKMLRRQRMLEREVGELNERVGTLKDGLDTTKGQLEKTEDELSQTRGRLKSLESELSNIEYELDKTEGELDLTKDKLKHTMIQLDTTKNQLDYVKSELVSTKKRLDDKQDELEKKQKELDRASVIINNAFTGEELEEEKRKLELRQEKLDSEKAALEKEKKAWERIKKSEASKREDLRQKCEERGGIINEDGYCTCPENEEWNPRTDHCDCVKGYKRDDKTGECTPCEVIKYNGECAEGGCASDESMVPLKKGPHKYVCIEKCRKKNEVWSKRKQSCVCKDGYYRNDKGECVPRR